MPDTEALIVDDSMSARFALNRSLQPHDMNVTQAKTGEEGVSTASEQAFDVIFMDHVLPGIDGLQAMEQIRAIPQHASTPIIMCTSNDTPDYREEALQRGADGVLCKPPDGQALSDILSTCLNAADTAPITDSADSTEETSDMSNDQQLQAIDQRLDRLEGMLERLETTVSQMDNRTKAVARAIADQAGRDLSNRLLRAVLTLKGK
ncbi:MAG: response regulator [Oceanococcus sp.]